MRLVQTTACRRLRASGADDCVRLVQTTACVSTADVFIALSIAMNDKRWMHEARF
jgi:hypothetical protein